jgi:hypothetical protein
MTNKMRRKIIIYIDNPNSKNSTIVPADSIDSKSNRNDNSTIYSNTPKYNSAPRYSHDESLTNTYVKSQSLTTSSLNSTSRQILSTDFRREINVLESMLLNELCESGVANPSEDYFNTLLDENELKALYCINLISWRNMGTRPRQISIIIGALHLLSHFDYEDVYPIGQTIAVAALSHKCDEVCEYALKCFENWGHCDSIDKLKSIRFSTNWLQDYANDIIRELESR